MADKRKLPAGALIGAMLAVALLSVIWQPIPYPPGLRTLIQIGSGAVIGCRFTKRDLTELRQVALPALLLVVLLLAWTFGFSLLIVWVSDLDLKTALFSCAPGGVSDLALIADEIGADTTAVSLLQLIRFVFVVSFFPPFLKAMMRSGRLTGRLQTQEPLNSALLDAADDAAAKTSPAAPHPAWLRILATFAVAAAGGFLLRLAGVPAGALLGALSLVIVLNLAGTPLLMPRRARTAMQIAAGCALGAKITRETLGALQTLLLPAAILLLEIMVMAFVTAVILTRATRLDPVTALFASIPGGIAEMALIADELGLDTPKIVVLHTVRVIAVIAFFPLLLHGLLHL